MQKDWGRLLRKAALTNFNMNRFSFKVGSDNRIRGSDNPIGLLHSWKVPETDLMQFGNEQRTDGADGNCIKVAIIFIRC